MLNGFKQFILRGNVVDLAVGVMMGAAFGSVVNALVKDLISPFISAVVKAPDFSTLSFTINSSKFLYGDFINALISFGIISATVYFFIVLPINSLTLKMSKKPPIDPTTKKCPECFTEIPIQAKRCPNCTSKI
ncbi:MAG: large conductance mechanosensitive channel protein MscL [Candidatus Nealsonbacteria bacterium]|nr:large conductance mechanosensitive channel protein MscL [Candidatus Nealsonbacteria bacterium]